MILPSTRVKLEIAAAIAVLAGGGIGFHSWIGEHDARLTAETTAKTSQIAFDKASEQIRIERAAEQLRDKESAERISGILADAAKAKTPEQIVHYLPTQLPTKIPIEISIPKPTIDNPTPNAIASIPQSELPLLRDTFAKCKTDAVALRTCTADIASRDREMAQADIKIKAMTDERDTWKKAAGATKWQRAQHVIELGLALAVGIAVDRAAAHK
jgi:hypothetical protein